MRYDTERCVTELSVGELCETALRGGDLFAPRAKMYAAAKEDKIRRRLQSEAGLAYMPDLPLSHTCLLEGMYYTVSGNADGVVKKDGAFLVESVQCVRGAAFYEPPREIFLAELKCYAYFLSVREELSLVSAELVYFDVDREKVKRFSYCFDVDTLREYYIGLLKKISKRAEFLRRRTALELPTASSARFPYRELREGQEIMIREGYSAIRRGQRLFVEAPTGTGKTISALYPAVRALGDGYTDKIFYLTAKASTRREAYSAAANLFLAGVRLRTVVITAKEQCCLCATRSADGSCSAAECEFARGYYDRVNDAIFELLEGQNGYPRKQIEAVAKKYRICPYELSLDLSEFCDIVICDYNYAFDPSVYFRRYFSADGMKGKYTFLIDEAHNLPDRAREMYSASLCRSAFEGLLSACAEEDGSPTAILDSALLAFRPLYGLCRDTLTKDADGREQGFFAAKQPPLHFDEAMAEFVRKSDAWYRRNRRHALAEPLAKLSSAVRRYLLVNEYFDRGFLSYVQVLNGDITVKSCCLDPSPILDQLLHRASASVFFSATLTPFDYYCSILGGKEKGAEVSLPSPFDSENLCVAVASYVSTRFEERQKNVGRFATLIAATVSARHGNYIAYFPSYDCLESVLKVFVKKYPKVETVVQKRHMGIKEREEFLLAFREDVGHLRVGFCVLGGAFSEGVDLPGSRLIGAIVFGVGLPGLSDERNMLRDYADPDGIDGYDYAYTFPGMNRVLQASGRVIRQAEDRGVVVLADDRYLLPKYRALFPNHWKNIQCAGNASSLAEVVKRFWDNARENE